MIYYALTAEVEVSAYSQMLAAAAGGVIYDKKLITYQQWIFWHFFRENSTLALCYIWEI